MRFYSSFAVIVGGLGVAAAACGGAAPTRPPGAPGGPPAASVTIGDAGANASLLPPTPPAVPPALRVAAVMYGRGARLKAWEKDRAIVASGLFVYEATKAGLVRLGELHDYADFAGGDDLVGLDTRPPPFGLSVHPHPTRLLLRAPRTSSEVREWKVDHWAPAPDVDPQRLSEVEHTDGFFSDGPPAPPGELSPKGCKPILTADDDAYGTCSNAPFVKLYVDPADLARTPPVWAGRFVQDARTFAAGLEFDAPMAVARDGALWFATRPVSGGPPTMHRIDPNGARTALDLPRPDARLARPSFVGETPESMSASYDRRADRYWQSTKLDAAPVDLEALEVVRIVPVRDGAVWIQAVATAKNESWPRHLSLVYRFGSGDHPAVTIGSPFDQQVELRNAGSARAWSDGCPQGFISTTASEADLQPILGGAAKKKVAARLVEGAFGSRAVRGVLLYHLAPNVDAKVLGELVARIARIAGAGQSSCSVPTPTRVLKEW